MFFFPILEIADFNLRYLSQELGWGHSRGYVMLHTARDLHSLLRNIVSFVLLFIDPNYMDSCGPLDSTFIEVSLHVHRGVNLTSEQASGCPPPQALQADRASHHFGIEYIFSQIRHYAQRSLV